MRMPVSFALGLILSGVVVLTTIGAVVTVEDLWRWFT